MMKTLFSTLIIGFIVVFTYNVTAQAPQNFNYQAIARDASGNLLVNQNVAFRISILQASIGGAAVYIESHNKTTNAYGQATLTIGGGTVLSGNLSNIDWGMNSYYLKTEMDVTGGDNFTLMGTTQLLSVPYALYSNSSGAGGTPYIASTGINITGHTISNTQPNATHTGDATGSEALTVVKIQGREVASTPPVAGQVLKWNENDSRWEPGNDNNTLYSAGAGISVSGNVITNTAQDQIVTLMGTGGTTISGTYPNFTINSTTGGGGSSTYTAGAGINISGNLITNTEPNATHTGDATGSNYLTVGKIQGRSVASTMPANGQALRWNSVAERWEPTSDNNTVYSSGAGISISGGVISNTAPDQPVALLSGSGISITGDYPEFTVSNSQPNATHTGDVIGNEHLTVVQLNGNPLSPNNPSAGQVLKWNGTQWDPSNVDALPSGAQGQTLMHDGSNWTASSNLYNDGYSVGINVTPATERFQVHNGNVSITNDNNTPGSLKIYEPSSDGLNFTAFMAQGQEGDITYTLPNTSGNAGDVLTTNGMGLLNWTSSMGILPSASLGQTLWNNGSNWLASDFLFNNDTSIGIGVTAPRAQLHLVGTSQGKGSVLFEGDYQITPGLAPAHGFGTRMMWYPDKAAFRAGYVDGPNWDTDSIGSYSVAMGFNTKASSPAATAMGSGALAHGDVSTSLGHNSKAFGIYAVAIGEEVISRSLSETSLGSFNTDYTPNSFADWHDRDRLFVIGNGTNESNRSNALTILKDGQTGLGTDYPLALLHTKGIGAGKGNVLFEGEAKILNPGSAPMSGAGTRFMWYPDKAAFRAGYVGGAHWDTDSIGFYSIAMGSNPKATGRGSVAMGSNTKASGEGSLALGFGTEASGVGSIALGIETSATGHFATATGNFTEATGNGATAMGESSTAAGWYSVAMGRSILSKSFSEIVIGCYNEDYTAASPIDWNANDRLFVIGNGNYNWDRSNALTMLKNGNTGLGTNNPSALFHTKGIETGKGNVLFEGEVKNINPGSAPMSGAGTRFMWYPDKAALRAGYVNGSQWDTGNIGIYSISMGNNVSASGEAAIALGVGNQASGANSIALGNFSTATGEGAIAAGGGTTSAGLYSTAFGNLTLSSGAISTALGNNTLAESFCETTLGSFNTNYSPTGTTTWVSTDRLFTIGNGTNDVNRSNALTLLKNGNAGFGIDAPAYKLDVKGNLNLNSTIASGAALYCNSAEALWYNGTYFSWGYGGGYNYFDKKLFIGTLYNPGSNYKLIVSGDAYATGSFFSASDLKFKKNINTLKNSLANVLKLRGTSYEFRLDEFKDFGFSTGEQVGFIAQELENFYPQLVVTDDKGFKSVNYSGLIPILTEAIKEQNAMIVHHMQVTDEQKIALEEQKRINEEQQILINDLLKRLEKLENK